MNDETMRELIRQGRAPDAPLTLASGTEARVNIERIVAALRELSDELVEYVRGGCEDGAAAYACGALDVLADQLDRVQP